MKYKTDTELFFTLFLTCLLKINICNSHKIIYECCQLEPGSLSVMLWTRPRCVAEVICHGPTIFCSSLVKSKPTWLHPGELPFKAKHYFFCVYILVEQPNEACRWKCLLICYSHVQANLHFHYYSPLSSRCFHISFSMVEPLFSRAPALSRPVFSKKAGFFSLIVMDSSVLKCNARNGHKSPEKSQTWCCTVVASVHSWIWISCLKKRNAATCIVWTQNKSVGKCMCAENFILSTTWPSGLNVVMLLVISAMVRGLKLNIAAVEWTFLPMLFAAD